MGSCVYRDRQIDRQVTFKFLDLLIMHISLYLFIAHYFSCYNGKHNGVCGRIAGGIYHSLRGL